MSEQDYSDRDNARRFYKSKEWSGVNGIRKQALARDDYECVWCKEEGRVTTTNLEVDHIVPLEEDPSKKTELDNLRTLC